MARGRPAVCSVGGGTRTCTLGSLGETLVDHDELVRLVSIFVDGQAGRRVFETLQTPIDAGRRLHQHHAGVVVGTASVPARSVLGSWVAPAPGTPCLAVHERSVVWSSQGPDALAAVISRWAERCSACCSPLEL